MIEHQPVRTTRKVSSAPTDPPASETAPAPGRGPRLLTARSFLAAHERLVDHLHHANYSLRTAPSWERLLADADEHGADAVLVDMDAADAAHATHRLSMSGHRLVTLLARQLGGRRTTLVVLTRLDFAEIEDLARAGVGVILSPNVSPAHSVEQIDAALERTTGPSQRRTQSQPSQADENDLASETTSGAISPVPTQVPHHA